MLTFHASRFTAHVSATTRSLGIDLDTKADNRRNLAILAFTLAVVMLGFGMVIPIFPFYIDRLGAGGRELGWLIAAYSLTQFLFAPIWGGVCDRVGRKPVLMLGILGNGASLLMMGLATELWMLFVARTLAGVLSAATLPTTMAYVSDSTSEEERGGGMGKLGAAMGLGVILGPGLGGWLAGGSLSTPFFVAAGLSLLSLLLILLLLPESLPKEARQRARGKVSAIDVGELWRALFGPIGILLLMAFLLSFGLTNFEAIFGLYALERFGYGPEEVGTILVVIGIVSAVAQGALTGPLTRRWGEAAVIRASLLASSVGFVLMLLANSYPAVLLTTGIFILSKTLLRPALTSLTSKQAGVGQGVAMGLTNSFMSLGRIAGPIWAGFLFDADVSFPYASGAVILFVGFLISLAWVTQDRKGATSAGLQPAGE
jgi:DHA1 family multidrug resistance protein-like MFS transporter